MNRAKIAGYVYSLPERVLRGVAALAGGVVREIGEVALPARVRRSRLYDSMVESTLRFLIEQIGQVDGAYSKEGELPKDFLVRRTAGNVIEAAGILAFRASPVWVFAALADVSGAGRDLIGEIAQALEKDGLLEPGRRFESADELLDGLERTAGRLAETVNTPPLDLVSLRGELTKLREDAGRLGRASVPTSLAVWSQWRELKDEAAAQGRSVFELSSAMAISAVRKLPDQARWLSNAASVGGRRTGVVLASGLLEHYRITLGEIRECGYGRYWIREFQPYLRGALRQFSPDSQTSTEKLLRRRRPQTPETPRQP